MPLQQVLCTKIIIFIIFRYELSFCQFSPQFVIQFLLQYLSAIGRQNVFESFTV